MEGIADIAKLISLPNDIVIFSHRNPDGDALGSSIGLQLYLESLGHQVSVVMPSEFPGQMNFLPKTDDILIFDFEQDKCLEKIKNAKLLFFLDFSGLDRIDAAGEYVIDHPAVKIHIDHHLDPEPFSDYLLSDINASSTSELIFEFLEKLNDKEKITKEIAQCLLTGIITDTGSFKYNTTRKTFNIAGELLDTGVDLNGLQDNIYNRQSEKIIRLLGHCLANRMEIIPEFRTGIIKLTRQDYIDFDIQRGDTEGIVNYLMMINGVEVGALITEQPTIIKLSLRSKGDISVQQIARDHFKGGGHKNAAGGAVYGTLEKTIVKFKSVLPNYIK
jgi:phosphoesterase RecJ-like protein